MVGRQDLAQGVADLGGGLAEAADGGEGEPAFGAGPTPQAGEQLGARRVARLDPARELLMRGSLRAAELAIRVGNRPQPPDGDACPDDQQGQNQRGESAACDVRHAPASVRRRPGSSRNLPAADRGQNLPWRRRHQGALSCVSGESDAARSAGRDTGCGGSNGRGSGWGRRSRGLSRGFRRSPRPRPRCCPAGGPCRRHCGLPSPIRQRPRPSGR